MASYLITGASRGIGLEFARQLGARGDRVVAACRLPGKARELNELAFAHPGHVKVLPVDLTRPASIVELAREAAMVVDSIDVAINNAGVLPEGERFGDISLENLETSLRTNAVGPLLLTQALVPLLSKGVAPRVVNISSVLGSIGSTDAFGTPSYSISKAALNMATRQCAHALREQGIAVFALHPGWVKTDMGTERAPIPPARSVTGMLRVVDASTLRDSGTFRDWQGKELPW